MAKAAITKPRLIQVHSSIQLSKNIQRIYFSSEDFSDFPRDEGGAHIKLFFPDEGQQQPLLPFRNELGKIVWPEGKRPVTRTYTIREFIENQQLLVIDFVRHEDFGIAANWAVHAKTGDILGLAGPGGPNRYNPQADYFVFIGDSSALPMIAASLEQLASTANGQVWIELDDPADQQHFTMPSGFEVFWCDSQSDFIAEINTAFSQLDWSKQNISVSLAGENSQVVELRKILRHQYQINKQNLYAVPYWRRGYSEENYHNERHRVMDAED